MSIETINHIERGLERTTSYFKTKEDYLKLLSIFLSELQEVSDALEDLSYIKDISTVNGVWLDYIGKIVGESRNGRSDNTYRKSLQLRVAINTADGTAPVIYEIVKTYTQSDKVRIAEGILSYGQLILDGTVNVDLSLVALIEEIQPVTVKTLILQDTENKCFFPAYEWTLTNLELFEVVVGGLPETLEVVLNELTPPQPLYVSSTGEQETYDPDTLGAEFLGWEEDEFLYLDTGELFEVVIEGVPKPFSVSIGTGVTDEVLLPWEITRETAVETGEPVVVGSYVGGENFTIESLVSGENYTVVSEVNEEE